MSFPLYSNAPDIYQYNEQINYKLLHICSEFFGFLELNYFGYGFYEGHTQFSIMTNLDFRRHTFIHKLFSTKGKIFQSRIAQLPFYKMQTFIETGKPKDKIQKCSFNFNIWNNISFMYREEKKFHCWTFGTNRENSDILNEYIEKRNLFEDFIKYFNHASSDFISSDNKLRIIHPDYKIPAYDPSYDEPFKQFQAKLLKATNSYTNKKMYLTKREIECINYLAQGKTVKEIARLLNLSPRTIETYLQNARLRLNCSNKSRLIDLFKCYYPY